MYQEKGGPKALRIYANPHLKERESNQIVKRNREKIEVFHLSTSSIVGHHPGYRNKYWWIKFEFKNNQYLHCRVIYPWEDLALEINYPPRSDWINCNLLQFNVIFVSTFPLNIMPTKHTNWKTICVRIHVYIS